MKFKCSILLLLISSISFLFSQTVVAPASGDGSTDNPYEICCYENLLWICENPGTWGNAFVQTQDIDANSSKLVLYGFPRIGNETGAFYGKYDGGGHRIKNLFINSDTSYVGLFGYTYNANIRYVHLDSVNVSGQDYVGGLDLLPKNRTV